jgi:hypothetical protein
MGKLRQFTSEHFKDIITVAFFTFAVFLFGKLFNSCIIPPVIWSTIPNCAINAAPRCAAIPLR